MNYELLEWKVFLRLFSIQASNCSLYIVSMQLATTTPTFWMTIMNNLFSRI